MSGSSSPSPHVRLVHTADLDAQTRLAARDMLDAAFDGELTDDDWEHALGGMHALVFEDRELVAHGAVVQRRLVHRGRALRTGYVESIGVRADRRRRGYGNTVMDSLERVIRGAYELGALGASEVGAFLYEARGWRQWQGRTWALTPDGLVRTAEEDRDVYVFDVSAELDLTGDLMCDWREGDLW